MENVLEISKIEVVLEGMADLVFDRFIDHSSEKRPPEQKLYLDENNVVVLPPGAIDSFLYRQLPPTGCALRFEAKQGKNYRAVGQANALCNESLIPIMRDGKPIVFSAFGSDGWYITNGSGITNKSGVAIKQENNPRPTLSMPWSVSFSITVVKNQLISEAKLYNWFVAGGIQIGLGNWRPQHGRFAVVKWEVKK